MMTITIISIITHLLSLELLWQVSQVRSIQSNDCLYITNRELVSGTTIGSKEHKS
jgi:hypothetical protein